MYFNNNYVFEERCVRVNVVLNLIDNCVYFRLRMLVFIVFKFLVSGVVFLMIIYFFIFDRKFVILVFFFDLYS